MIDHGEALRQKFISDYAVLEAKRADLRARMHAEGKYFIGEEALAKRNGGKVFHPFKGWRTITNGK